MAKPGISQEVLGISEVIPYPGKNTKTGGNGERLTLVILWYLLNSEIEKILGEFVKRWVVALGGVSFNVQWYFDNLW